MEKAKVTPAKSTTSPDPVPVASGLRRWIKVGAVAAASALAGGVAAAWYYRKTLKTLQEAEYSAENPESGIPDSETEYDI